MNTDVVNKRNNLEDISMVMNSEESIVPLCPRPSNQDVGGNYGSR